MITIELEVTVDQLSNVDTQSATVSEIVEILTAQLSVTHELLEATEWGSWVSFTGDEDELATVIYGVYGPGFDEWALEQVEAGVVRPLVDESR